MTAPWRKLYGRRHGKRLRPAQQRSLEDLLPRLRLVGVSPEENPERTLLPPPFPDGRPLWLEIGFGGGEHLVHQARSHPEIGLIGCEPFVNGVAMMLGRIADDDPGNIRLHPGDARDLLEVLPTASLSRVFLLYPDPWPKTRHHPRRFMNPENLALLAPKMAPGAELRVATDIADYARHALWAAAETPVFREVARDHALAWEDWPGTRYEAKALVAGRRPTYLGFVRE